jgi:CelD/BcsL family acetyltransferase involved in cellulose biosynthesis
LPFTDHCPPLGADALVPELVRELVALRRRERLSRIVVRDGLPATDPEVVPFDAGVVHAIALPADPETAFGAFSSGHRRDVRIAERAGLRASSGTTTSDVDAFIRLHTMTRKRLGVPVQPHGFLRAVGAALAAHDLGFITVVRRGDEPLAAGLFLFTDRTVLFKYSASDATAWKLCPNNLLVWTAIVRAIELGATVFDFGRSELSQEGLRAFKRRFGAQESPLVYTAIGSAPERGGIAPGALSQHVIRRSPQWVGRAVGRALYRYVA